MLGGLCGNGLFGGSERGFVSPSAGGGDSDNTVLGPPMDDSFIADRGEVTGLNGQGKPIDQHGVEVVPSPGGSTLFLPKFNWRRGQGNGLLSTLTQGNKSSQAAAIANLSTAILCPGDEPIKHTTFLGASIMDFSVSLGYGEQSSSLTVRLAEDLCEGGSKIYYQGHKNLKLGNTSTLREVSTTKADKFEPPSVGSAVYFRMGNFEFTGVFQSFTKTRSPSGNPVYSVTLIDPRELLAGVSLIIADEYSDAVLTPNIINVFAIMEKYGVECPTTGGGAFGGAAATEEGMPWNNIYTGLNISQSGLSAFTGITPKRPRMGGCEYLVDLTNLPVPPVDYRMGGTSITLLDAISRLCEDAGYEYFLDLIPVIVGGGTLLILKVRCVDRTTQPNLDAIENFIDDPDNQVMESSNGLEFRNDVTSAMVIGGKKTNLFECECPGAMSNCNFAGIQPYWGVDDNENLITGCRVSKPTGGFEYQINVPTSSLNETLEKMINFSTYTITESEMRAAMMGEKSWTGWITNQKNHPIKVLFFGNQPLQYYAFQALEGVLKKAKQQGWGENGVAIKPQHFVQANKSVQSYVSKQIAKNTGKKDLEDLSKVFTWISSFAKRYGKEWIVPLEGLCTINNTIDGVARQSFQPTDKAWSDAPAPLGLNGSLAQTVFGGDDADGRYTSFVRFNLFAGGAFNSSFGGAGVNAGSRIDFSKFTKGEYYVNGNNLWLKAGSSKEIAYLDKANMQGPHSILKIGSAVQAKIESEQGVSDAFAAFMRVMKIAAGKNSEEISQQLRRGVGANLVNMGMAHEAMSPVAAAVPIQYDGFTYGPWETSGAVDGKTRVEVNEELTPWNYAGYALLAVAGQDLADQQVTNMQSSEMGSIKVPGLPDKIRIGWELNQVRSDFALVENRTPKSITIPGGGQINGGASFYYIDEPTMNNSYGPNLTGIQVTVAAGGITSQYNFRTYTPKYAQFAKLNAERLKKMARARIAANKDQRKFNLKSLQLQGKGFRGMPGMDGFGGGAAGAGGGGGGEAGGGQPKGAHQQGQQVGKNQDGAAGGGIALTARAVKMKTPDGNTGVSVDMGILPGSELQNTLDESYGEKAIVGLDSLFYPVSLGGDGGLPPLASPAGSCINSKSTPARPNGPYNATEDNDKQLFDGDYDINNLYLQPFQNPRGLSFAQMHLSAGGKDKRDNINEGHSNDLVARGADAPETTLYSEAAEYDSQSEAYSNDYRFLALKGPLMLHGWGYDLQGKPVPNEADSSSGAAAGSFTTGNLTDKFLPGFLRDTHTWPTAPIDLRYDRARGVWTTPQPPRFMKVLLESEGSETELAVGAETQKRGSSGLTTKEVGESPAAWTKDGSSGEDDRYVIVKNDGAAAIPVGTTFKVYYDDFTCKWLPFAVTCADEIIIATMVDNMLPDANGEATVICPPDREGQKVRVINSLNQPISAHKQVILWKKCGDCGVNCPSADGEDEDGDGSYDTGTGLQGGCYRVLQAEFCPLNVVTSVYVEERYEQLNLGTASPGTGGTVSSNLKSGGGTEGDGACNDAGDVKKEDINDIEFCNKKIVVKVWVDEYAQVCETPVVTSTCGGPGPGPGGPGPGPGGPGPGPGPEGPGPRGGGCEDDEPYCGGEEACCRYTEDGVEKTVSIDDQDPCETADTGKDHVSSFRCLAAKEDNVWCSNDGKQTLTTDTPEDEDAANWNLVGKGLGGELSNCSLFEECLWENNRGETKSAKSYCSEANNANDGRCAGGPCFECKCCDLSNTDWVAINNEQDGLPTGEACCELVPINKEFTEDDCERVMGGDVVRCPVGDYIDCDGADDKDDVTGKCCVDAHHEALEYDGDCRPICADDDNFNDPNCRRLADCIEGGGKAGLCGDCPEDEEDDPTDDPDDPAEYGCITTYKGGHKDSLWPGPIPGADICGPGTNDILCDGLWDFNDLDYWEGEANIEMGMGYNRFPSDCDECVCCEASDGTIWPSHWFSNFPEDCTGFEVGHHNETPVPVPNSLGGKVIWCPNNDPDVKGGEMPECGWCCLEHETGKLTPIGGEGGVQASACAEFGFGSIVSCDRDAVIEGNRAGQAEAYTDDDDDGFIPTDEDEPFDNSGSDASLGGGEVGGGGIVEPRPDSGDKAGLEPDGSTHEDNRASSGKSPPTTTAGYSSGSTGSSNPCDLSSLMSGSTSSDNVTLKVCTVVPDGAITTGSCATQYPDVSMASFKISSCADYKFNMEFEHVQYPLLWIDVCERTIYLQTAFSNPICGIQRRADIASLYEHSTKNSLGLQMPVFNAPYHPNVEKQFGFPNGFTSKIQTGTYEHDKQYEANAPEPAISFKEGTAYDDSIFSWEACYRGLYQGTGGTTSPGETLKSPSTISSGKDGNTANWGITKPPDSTPPQSSYTT